MQKDPYELSNEINNKEYAKVRNELKQILIKKMVEVGEEKPTILPAYENETTTLGLKGRLKDFFRTSLYQ